MKEPAVVTEAKKLGAVDVSQNTKYKADPLKQASIERQVALKEAVSMYIAGKIEREEIKTLANEFAKWLGE